MLGFLENGVHRVTSSIKYFYTWVGFFLLSTNWSCASAGRLLGGMLETSIDLRIPWQAYSVSNGT